MNKAKILSYFHGKMFIMTSGYNTGCRKHSSQLTFIAFSTWKKVLPQHTTHSTPYFKADEDTSVESSTKNVLFPRSQLKWWIVVFWNKSVCCAIGPFKCAGTQNVSWPLLPEQTRHREFSRSGTESSQCLAWKHLPLSKHWHRPKIQLFTLHSIYEFLSHSMQAKN